MVLGLLVLLTLVVIGLLAFSQTSQPEPPSVFAEVVIGLAKSQAARETAVLKRQIDRNIAHVERMATREMRDID